MPHYLESIGMMWAYAISAVLMLVVILWIFDRLTPKIKIEKELVENKNLAVAIPAAAVILAVAAIIVAVIVS